MSLKDSIRTIENFPKPGIMFRDVTTLFGDASAFRKAVDLLVHPWVGKGIDKIVGLEARGFILGGAMAHQLSIGFVPIRKKGKLPAKTFSQAYQLEYGEEIAEIHQDALEKGERVLIVDDLLATGGTVMAAKLLVEKLEAVVAGCAFVIELPELGGGEILRSHKVTFQSLVQFDGH